jgi:hypothetical protein
VVSITPPYVWLRLLSIGKANGLFHRPRRLCPPGRPPETLRARTASK